MSSPTHPFGTVIQIAAVIWVIIGVAILATFAGQSNDEKNDDSGLEYSSGH